MGIRKYAGVGAALKHQNSPGHVILSAHQGIWQIIVAWEHGARCASVRHVRNSIRARLASMGETWRRGPDHDELWMADRIVARLMEPAWIGPDDSFGASVLFEAEGDAMLARLALSSW